MHWQFIIEQDACDELVYLANQAMILAVHGPLGHQKLNMQSHIYGSMGAITCPCYHLLLNLSHNYYRELHY